MGKLSDNDKLRMQTLREQGLGVKAIKVCSRVDHTGSALLRKAGSGRPATASACAVCRKTILTLVDLTKL